MYRHLSGQTNSRISVGLVIECQLPTYVKKKNPVFMVRYFCLPKSCRADGCSGGSLTYAGQHLSRREFRPSTTIRCLARIIYNTSPARYRKRRVFTDLRWKYCVLAGYRSPRTWSFTRTWAGITGDLTTWRDERISYTSTLAIARVPSKRIRKPSVPKMYRWKKLTIDARAAMNKKKKITKFLPSYRFYK